MTIEIYFDGGTRGNRICIVRGNSAKYGSKKIRALRTKQTNNQLEYSALLWAVRSIKIHEGISTVSIIGDSELIIKQMKGQSMVKSKRLIDLYEQVVEELKLRNLHLIFYWVPRTENLAGIELDKI